MSTANKSNQIIQSLWIGDKLSNVERLCVQSFLQQGHDFHLYTYQYIDNIPRGITLLDANSIIPFNKIFKDSSGGFSGFSNWFRYQLLYDIGGWWVDMDSVCMNFFDIPEKYCFSSERDQEQNVIINCGFIKAIPKADFLVEILEYISSCDHSNVKWGQFGPRLFNTVIQTYDSKNYVKPPEAFCPINWYDMPQLVQEKEFLFDNQTFAIHLWNDIWRRKNLNKNATYHPDCLYEQLKMKYQIL